MVYWEQNFGDSPGALIMRWRSKFTNGNLLVSVFSRHALGTRTVEVNNQEVKCEGELVNA